MAEVLSDTSKELLSYIKDWKSAQIEAVKKQVAKEIAEEKKRLTHEFNNFSAIKEKHANNEIKQIINQYESKITLLKKSHELQNFSHKYDAVISEVLEILGKKGKETNTFFSKIAKHLTIKYGKGKISVPKHVKFTGATATLDELCVQLKINSDIYELSVEEYLHEHQDVIRGIVS